MSARKSILKGAVILTAANLLTRILGFVYRIYMSNTIGAEGMGLYSLIMPIYGLCWSITCSGITTSVSKLVAAENARREYGNMGRILKQALAVTVGLSVIVALILYFFSGAIAHSIIKDGRTELSLRLLAFAVPFMAAGSSIRGYFFGLQETKTPAISQVFEQIVRMAAIYILAGTMIPKGLEYACAAAVIGVFAGELLSFVYVIFSYKLFKSKQKLIKKPNMSSVAALSALIGMSLPLTLNRICGSLLGTVENLLIPQSLQQFGMTQAEAVSTLGRISAMAMPLIFFPSAILNSLSIALVPAVSEAMAVGNKTRVGETISKSLMFTAVTGIFACMVFLVVPDELGRAIYNQEIGGILFMLGLMCPLWYLNISFSGILNGLGKQLLIFGNSLLSSAITIASVYFLVPKYGISAFIFGWFASLAIVTVISIINIRGAAGIKIPFVRWFIKPAIAALGTGLLMEYGANHFFMRYLGEAVGVIVTIAVMAAVYFVFILALGCISIDDVKKLYKRFIPGDIGKQAL